MKKGQDLPVVLQAQIDREVAADALKIAPNGAAFDMTFSQTSSEGVKVAMENLDAFHGKEGLVEGGVSYMFRVPSTAAKTAKKYV